MKVPSMDEWLMEAKKNKNSEKCGMYLFHNGVVRMTPKAVVRFNEKDEKKVIAMDFSYDQLKVENAVKETLELPGIYYVRTWLNDGRLLAGDDIMLVLVGGDIRPHIIDALNFLVGKIKDECVTETEIYDNI